MKNSCGHKNNEFEELFRQMYPKVKGFACKILQSEEDAEDIAQDVFIKLLNSPQIWENLDSRNSYIYTLTRNHIFNFLKHKSVENKYQEEVIFLNEISDNDDIHNHLYAKELKLLIDLIIHQMPEQRRKIFLLSRVQRKSHAEIAQELGLSVRTVERHVYLALSELKKIILIFPLLFVA